MLAIRRRAGPEAADLVGAMLAADHANRPDTSQVLQHPLFWSLAEKVRYINRIHRRLGADDALKAAVDRGGSRCWEGGDWRRHRRPRLKHRRRQLWPPRRPPR